jgi:hypothetical protein
VRAASTTSVICPFNLFQWQQAAPPPITAAATEAAAIEAAATEAAATEAAATIPEHIIGGGLLHLWSHASHGSHGSHASHASASERRGADGIDARA